MYDGDDDADFATGGDLSEAALITGRVGVVLGLDMDVNVVVVSRAFSNTDEVEGTTATIEGRSLAAAACSSAFDSSTEGFGMDSFKGDCGVTGEGKEFLPRPPNANGELAIEMAGERALT